jgi:hypothetical protein
VKQNEETAAEPVETTSEPVPFETVLTGTTLRVYKLLVTTGRPIGPREIQRALKLSSHTIASFHLEKLMRHGLAVRNELTGAYSVNRLYLKHYVLMRRHLIPRYFFYAFLFSAMAGGWISLLFFGGLLNPAVTSFSRTSVFELFLFGLAIVIAPAAIFWFESSKVLRNEAI